MAASQMLALIYKTLGILTGLLASVGIVGVIDFSGGITLGSVLIAAVIAACALFFTIRSKIAEVWRLEAEGQRAAKETAEEALAEEKESRTQFDREQQELRHELKGELAGYKAQLKAMEAKTDLTAALQEIQRMNESTVVAVADAISEPLRHSSELSQTRDARTHELLEEIRDKLPSEPIAVHEIDPTS